MTTAIRRAINAALGLGLIGSVSYCSYNFATAESRVRELCSEIEVGMPVAALREFALAHGLGPIPQESGVSYIVESKSFGRFGCKVNVEAGRVREAEYSFAS